MEDAIQVKLATTSIRNRLKIIFVHNLFAYRRLHRTCKQTKTSVITYLVNEVMEVSLLICTASISHNITIKQITNVNS